MTIPLDDRELFFSFKRRSSYDLQIEKSCHEEGDINERKDINAVPCLRKSTSLSSILGICKDQEIHLKSSLLPSATDIPLNELRSTLLSEDVPEGNTANMSHPIMAKDILSERSLDFGNPLEVNEAMAPLFRLEDITEVIFSSLLVRNDLEKTKLNDKVNDLPTAASPLSLPFVVIHSETTKNIFEEEDYDSRSISSENSLQDHPLLITSSFASNSTLIIGTSDASIFVLDLNGSFLTSLPFPLASLEKSKNDYKEDIENREKSFPSGLERVPFHAKSMPFLKDSIDNFDQENSVIDTDKSEYISALSMDSSYQYILAGTSKGRLYLWQWTSLTVIPFGSYKNEKGSDDYINLITSVSFPSISASTVPDCILFATANGNVYRRVPSILSSFTDTLLYTSSSSLMDQMWTFSDYDLVTDQHIACRDIRGLNTSSNYLYFTSHDTSFIYHEKKSKLITRFRSNTQEFTRSKIAYGMKCINQRNQFIVVQSNDCYIYENIKSIKQDRMFNLKFQFQFPFPILDAALIGYDKLVVILLDHRLLEIVNLGKHFSWNGICHHDLPCPFKYIKAIEKPYRLVISILDLCSTNVLASSSVLIEPNLFGHWNGLSTTFKTEEIPFANDSDVTDDKIRLKISKSSLTLNRVYLVFQKRILLLRPICIDEKITWHVEGCQYVDAINLCCKFQRYDRLIEAADAYAIYLWDMGLHQQSIDVIAEYILPTASKEYWREWTVRLYQIGRLPLIERYLPLDNNGLLLPETYYNLLEHYISEEQYAVVLDRISRWPVIYPIQRLMQRLLEEIDKEIFKSHPLLYGQDLEDLLRSIFKLYDFQNLFTEAFLVLLSINEGQALEYFYFHKLMLVIFSNHTFILDFVSDACPKLYFPPRGSKRMHSRRQSTASLSFPRETSKQAYYYTTPLRYLKCWEFFMIEAADQAQQRFLIYCQLRNILFAFFSCEHPNLFDYLFENLERSVMWLFWHLLEFHFEKRCILVYELCKRHQSISLSDPLLQCLYLLLQNIVPEIEYLIPANVSSQSKPYPVPGNEFKRKFLLYTDPKNLFVNNAQNFIQRLKQMALSRRQESLEQELRARANA